MIVLVLGSGPSALAARGWPRAPFDRIVAINNAWQIRSDWDDLVYPYDFPPEKMPSSEATGALIDQTQFVPAQNAFGGFVYGGATMAFTATYWALHALRPSCIAYLGCDMVYSSIGATHFYGTGTADPLRKDISLRSLEAKSARARIYAARQGCALINLSRDPSRLLFPRAMPDTLPKDPAAFDATLAQEADLREAELDYRTPSGFHDHITADLAAIDALDALWIRAGGCDPATRGASDPPRT